MNQTFVKSTLILTVATLASKIIGSIFRIPLQNIAGDEVLGIFSLVYPVYMVALILSVAGIPIAISQLISSSYAKQDQESIFKIYKTAIILTWLFGFFSFSIICLFSSQMAAVLGGPSTRPALIIVSATLLIAPYMAVYRGYFQGIEDMRPTAISQVLEQLIRVGCILIFAHLLVKQGHTNEVVSGGIMIGSIMGAIASAIYLQSTFRRSPFKPDFTSFRYTYRDFKETGKRILFISLPICIGAITMALLNFIDSVTIPFSLKNAESEQNIHYMYGIYGRGLSLVQIATVFSSSIVLPLIPLLTKTLAEKNFKHARKIVERVHYLTHLVSWPIATGLAALTLPINLALFKDMEGSSILFVIGFSSVFTSLTILGTGILQGINLAKQAAYMIVGAVLLKVITNVVLIHIYGLMGAAYSTLIVYLVIFIGNTILIGRVIPFSVWKWKTTSIVLSSIIMGALVGGSMFFFELASWSRLGAFLFSISAAMAGALIYLALIHLTKGFDRDILNFLPSITAKFSKRKK